ncbi:MAG: hypothetical protein ACI85I_001130 [Arenicella sp.]|jgi:hypothetical protein
MKFNWGHGITLFSALFMSMILYFVISSVNYDSELVSEDYYENEINYQTRIDKERNASKEKINISQEATGLQIVFLNSVDKGTVQFFRPSNKELDFQKPIQLNSNFQQQIGLENTKPGLWRIKLDWQKGGKDFYYEESVVIK